jgi:hypothetical protein
MGMDTNQFYRGGCGVGVGGRAGRSGPSRRASRGVEWRRAPADARTGRIARPPPPLAPPARARQRGGAQEGGHRPRPREEALSARARARARRLRADRAARPMPRAGLDTLRAPLGRGGRPARAWRRALHGCMGAGVSPAKTGVASRVGVGGGRVWGAGRGKGEPGVAGGHGRGAARQTQRRAPSGARRARPPARPPARRAGQHRRAPRGPCRAGVAGAARRPRLPWPGCRRHWLQLRQ